jgi:hypothetical protein
LGLFLFQKYLSKEALTFSELLSKTDFGIGKATFLLDLVHLQSNFFCPPNFSFVFWKKEFWREKITLQRRLFDFYFRKFSCSKSCS